MAAVTGRSRAVALLVCLLCVAAVSALTDRNAPSRYTRRLKATASSKTDWRCQGVPSNSQNSAMQFSSLCLLVPGTRKCPGKCATGYSGKPYAQQAAAKNECIDRITNDQCSWLPACRLGQWVFSGKCTQGGGQAKSCSKMPADPDNGAFPEACAGTASGKTCEAVCDDGYVGAPVATCTNGKWAVNGTCEADNPPAAECVASDYDFTVEADRQAWESCCSALAEQGIANEDCDNPPGCDGDPAEVPDGVWEGCDGTAHNEECVNFTCSEGFDSADTPVSALCYMGTWLEPVGECVPLE